MVVSGLRSSWATKLMKSDFRRPAQVVVEARVLDGDGSLVRERGEHGKMAFRKETGLYAVVEIDDAEQSRLRHKRNAKNGTQVCQLDALPPGKARVFHRVVR